MNTFYDRNKQLIDQTAHFAVGLGFVVVMSIIAPILVSMGVMMALAIAREIIQHEGFDLGFGSALDLAFFFVGGFFGCVISALIY